MRILITGGTSGIGLELVRYLADMHEVIVVCRNKEKMDSYKLKLQNVFEADLSDIEQTKEVANKITNIDILINNAGMPLTRKIIECAGYSTNKTVVVNLISPYVLADRLLSKGAVKKVINVGSATHWCGTAVTEQNANNPSCDHYSNTKFSLLSMGAHLKEKYSDAQIITTNPGYVDTGIWHPRAPGEWLHKHIRKWFALKPVDTIQVFDDAISKDYSEHVYLTPYKKSHIITFLTKYAKSFMLMNDFFGKTMLLTGKAEKSDIYSECLTTTNISDISQFLMKFNKN